MSNYDLTKEEYFTERQALIAKYEAKEIDRDEFLDLLAHHCQKFNPEWSECISEEGKVIAKRILKMKTFGDEN